jgi:small subunit ribosomal protein S19
MGRSLKKGPFVDEKLYRKVEKLNERNKREPIKTWARRCTIVPEFVGHTFKVHNGRAFLDVFVTEDMVGHKLGEFSITRTLQAGTRTRRKASSRATRPARAVDARVVRNRLLHGRSGLSHVLTRE